MTDTVVVLTALESEHAAVRDLIEEPAGHRHAAGTRFTIGRIRGGRVALAAVGAGNGSAAVLAERAITEFRPRAVLFTGIAGALHDDLELGSVVVATKIYGYHGGFEQLAGFGARPQAWDADHELEQIARLVSRDGTWHRRLPTAPAVRFRPIAAGEVVLDARESPLAHHLRQHFEDAAAIELESAGTAKAAQLNRAPFLAVRGISDKADGRKYETDGDGWQAVAARHAAAFTLAVAAELLASAPAAPRTPARRVSRPVDVTWRTDLTDSRSAAERCALEVHLVPLDDYGRLEAHRLGQLLGHLSDHGRACGLFTGTERVATDVGDRAAWVRSVPSPDGHSGLAVHLSGQRSVWLPLLPYNARGPVLDRDALTEQLERSLLRLAEMPGLPSAASVALAAGLEPAAGLAEIGRSTGFCTAAHIRVLSESEVPIPSLLHQAREAAGDLSARLHEAFRQAC
ncbi:5'-methylthioadenosine/S-adenosylhomocysteine nucleosidase [Lentzea sp.]|uniref:5'-methylthioadenosine/S-adenosylhomocysteine nucleosidase family protein n=1 Tax=Lentzea sp. TaxID=56099 RepID=UPI002D13D15C|nr:5'-methylthioadenosine/S-adenosylhomocysteine nucleosidase [Lentzea sp.]HUQ58487.1 5'-methylthioadenosine/S-adenosylhomocysteine nucleosidase [Lentzea sp.]